MDRANLMMRLRNSADDPSIHRFSTETVSTTRLQGLLRLSEKF